MTAKPNQLEETCNVDILVLNNAANENEWKRWYFFADTVMGGISSGQIVRKEVLGRTAIEMRGTVSLENNGGFIQIAMDFDENGGEQMLFPFEHENCFHCQA